jgi:hypothetical protein
MWLASTSLIMNLARVAMIGLMLGLVFTNPPRQRQFRRLLSVAALVFLAAALGRAYSGSMQLIDALLFLEAAVAFGLAAVEGNALVAAEEPLPASAEPESLVRRYQAISNSQGLLVPHHLLTRLFIRSLLMMSVTTGALYENARPSHTLWRGS